MSLQVLAQDMASRGRGPDTMLVHMAPREVAGLQALAMAHGGSLSINPKTGLPEAGFLSSLLPMLIGVGLTAATGGAITPLMAGIGVGGFQTLRTGSLEKGLMAGLGAYGGAGLTGGIMGAGTGAISAGAGAEAASAFQPVVPVEAAMPVTGAATPYFPEGVGIGGEFMRPAYEQGALGSGTFDSAKILDTGGGAYNTLATPAAAPTANTMIAPSITPAQAFPSATGAGPNIGLTREAADIGNAYDLEMAQQRAVQQKLAAAGPADKLKVGFEAIGKDPSKLFNAGNLKYGAAAAAPLLFQEPEKGDAYKGSGPNPYRYTFDPGTQTYTAMPSSSAEDKFFDPRYTRMAEGGLSSFAEGGAFERMLNRPSPDAESYKYSYDPATQTYTRAKQGLAALADIANTYTYDPNTQTYTATATPTAKPEVQNNAGVAVQQPGGGPSDSGPGPGPGPGADPSMDSAGLSPADSPADSGSAAADAASPYASGGISHLGDYSDGGRLLRGPGDGVSDDIPATIADKRPARLADGEFVVPARIVSELGNGSTEAGARKLYAMMDRIQKNRTKSVGKGKVAVNSRSERMLPA